MTFLKSNLENYRFLAQVLDQDSLSDDYIGQIEIPLHNIIKKPGKVNKGIYDLYNKQGKSIPSAQIEIELKFIND